MSAINSSGIENEKKNEKKNENKKMMKRSAYNNAARTIDSIIISCEPAEYATARINNRKFKRMIDVLSLEQRMQLFARLITGVYIIPFLRLVFLAFIFHYGFLHLFHAMNTMPNSPVVIMNDYTNSNESGPTFRNVSSNVSLPLALSNSTMQVSFQDSRIEPSRKKLLRPPFVITLNDTLQLIDLAFPLLPETAYSIPKPKPKLSKTISSKSKENAKINKIINTKIKKAKVVKSKTKPNARSKPSQYPNHQANKSPIYGYLVMENGIAIVYENGDIRLYEKITPDIPTY